MQLMDCNDLGCAVLDGATTSEAMMERKRGKSVKKRLTGMPRTLPSEDIVTVANDDECKQEENEWRLVPDGRRERRG